MSISSLLPFASTIIIFVFAFLVFRRYTRRKGLHLLVWGIGLVWFGLGSLAEAYSALAWNATLFRLWYLGGAVLNAAWLGQGTVYLLVRRKVGGIRLADAVGQLIVQLFGDLAPDVVCLETGKFGDGGIAHCFFLDLMPLLSVIIPWPLR